MIYIYGWRGRRRVLGEEPLPDPWQGWVARTPIVPQPVGAVVIRVEEPESRIEDLDAARATFG